MERPPRRFAVKSAARAMTAGKSEPERAGDDLGFSFRATKQGEVRIERGGQTVTVLRGAAARRLLASARPGRGAGTRGSSKS